ncbi:glucose transport transcription regulator RGT1 [Rhypophila decipiens]|uniref:Glucose transport transcription regulator RGT1 n=1 Tax=Rhypophila decipiens TaxID=261697 RepID=A0AAN7BBH2_9PEZI|nr:glucose transport transcription regulator RGT1 [Rhypophila decipiens]
MFEQQQLTLPKRQPPVQLPDSPRQESTPVTVDDKKAIAVEAENVMMQYPSPSDAPDGQYYHLPTREQVLAQQAMAQQVEQEQPSQADLAALQEHQQHQEQNQVEEHHNLHELQELQSSPTQHHNAAVVSVDEFQLAAQLTQGLAQSLTNINMMNDVQQQEPVQESQLHPQEDVEMQNQSDVHLHEQLQAQLENHDHMQSQQQQMQPQEELQAHSQLQSQQGMQVHQEQLKVDHELQGQHQQLQAQAQQQHLQHHEGLQSHDQQLQEVLSHSQQSQAQHLYGQNPPQLQHGQSHSPIDGLPNSPYPLLDANTPPRKRSKVSRACDECRRKKIKCDAQSEPGGGLPCSNCRRAGAQCLFSRVPQKRGPSKGYIKELADRINNIEGKFGISKEDSATRRASAEAYPSPTPGDDSRKRPYSTMSVDGFSAASPAGQPPWVSEHKPIRPYNAEPRPPYSVNDLAPKPETPAPMLCPMESLPPAQPDTMDGMVQNGLVPNSVPVAGLPRDTVSQEPQQPKQVREIDDVRFDCYLNVIHRTFPILAGSKRRVGFLLEQCPTKLHNAFLHAFYALLKPFIQNAPDLDFGSSLTAFQLMHEWEMERHTPALVTNLVHLQTLVMLVIEADYHGLTSIKGEAAGPAKQSILARAVGVGFNMRLYLAQPSPTPGPDFDPDANQNVSLRAWWTLIMLDRWNAMGTASPLLVSNDTVVVFPGLRYIVGDAVFLSLKLSYYLGLFKPLGVRPSLDPFGESPPEIGSFSNAIAESLRWQFPAELDEAREPGLHLAYWHFRLLAQLFSMSWSPELSLQCCSNIVRLLLSNAQLINPLTHHFVSLCSLVLMELTKADMHREEAKKLAKDLVDFGIAPSPWNSMVQSTLAAKLAALGPTGPDFDKKAVQGETNQNLQQLADLPASVEETLPQALNSDATTQGQDPAAAPDAATDTLKEELLDSIKGLQYDQQPPPATVVPCADGPVATVNNNSNFNTASSLELVPRYEKATLDPRAILRTGYLLAFLVEEQEPQPSPQPPPESQSHAQQHQQEATIPS